MRRGVARRRLRRRLGRRLGRGARLGLIGRLRRHGGLAGGAHDTALRVAHTLKRTGALMGAKRLAELAAHLEQMLRANQDLRVPDTPLLAAMNAVSGEVAVLARALSPEPASIAAPSGPVTPE